MGIILDKNIALRFRQQHGVFATSCWKDISAAQLRHRFPELLDRRQLRRVIPPQAKHAAPSPIAI